jgi:polyhydroxybutyrate depolymerase
MNCADDSSSVPGSPAAPCPGRGRPGLCPHPADRAGRLRTRRAAAGQYRHQARAVRRPQLPLAGRHRLQAKGVRHPQVPVAGREPRPQDQSRRCRGHLPHLPARQPARRRVNCRHAQPQRRQCQADGARRTERDYHWDAEAGSGHFVVVYPDWEEYAGANQSDFIPAIVAAIERHNPIDSSRVYAAGISLGGTEAYFLVCSSKIFAAIGVDSARELGTCDRPAPISVIHIHGTADHIVPYHQPPRSDIPQLNATWRRIDHCAAPAVSTAGAVTTSIAACPAGRTVELVTIAGAGHQWPGGVPGTGMGDPPSTALNATQVIWEFFAKHHR